MKDLVYRTVSQLWSRPREQILCFAPLDRARVLRMTENRYFRMTVYRPQDDSVYCAISFGFPALGAEREFDPIGGDENGSDFRTGEVADDVECLEIMAEPVVFPDRYRV